MKYVLRMVAMIAETGVNYIISKREQKRRLERMRIFNEKYNFIIEE